MVVARVVPLLVTFAIALAGCASPVMPPVQPDPTSPHGTDAVPSAAASTSTPAASPTWPPESLETSGPQSTASPLPTASPDPADTQHWKQIGSPKVRRPGSSTIRVAGFKNGYVLIKVGPQFFMPPGDAAYFSPDGRKWRRIALPASGLATATTVVSTGRRILIAGFVVPCGPQYSYDSRLTSCRMRPASWVSTDGLTWRSSGTWQAPFGEVGTAGSTFANAWRSPRGGWEAAQVFYGANDENEDPPIGLIVWHSTDGRSWHRMASLTRKINRMCRHGLEDYDPFLVDASGATRLARVQCGDGRRWLASRDGRQWEPVPGPRRSVWVGEVVPPTPTTPWLAFGWDDSPTVWVSRDLTSWSAAKLPVPSGVEALGSVATAVVGDRVFAAMAATDEAVVWTTYDGIDWDVALADQVLEHLIAGPAGLLGAGVVKRPGGGYKVEVWAPQ